MDVEFTFKDFLAEGGEGSGRPDDGKRPKNTLWFTSPYYWYADMSNKHGGTSDLHVVDVAGNEVSIAGEEGEEVAITGQEDLYVVDKDKNHCYGAWKKNYKRGITFEKPRPFSIVKRNDTKY